MQRHREIAGQQRHVRGWKRGPKNDPTVPMLKAGFFERMRLPSKASLRDKWVRIENQGDAGSCTANATTSCMEYLAKKEGKPVTELSRLYLYARTRQFEGTPLTEDSGAVVADVMKVVQKYGVCAESLWPYNTNKFTIDPPASCDVDAEKHQVLFHYRCASLMTIKASIAQGYPVVGGFQCPVNMFTDAVAKTGIVPMPDAQGFDGGHCIAFAEYDDQTRLVWFANSWGEDCGEKGWWALPYAYFEKNWADDYHTIRREEF